MRKTNLESSLLTALLGKYVERLVVQAMLLEEPVLEAPGHKLPK